MLFIGLNANELGIDLLYARIVASASQLLTSTRNTWTKFAYTYNQNFYFSYSRNPYINSLIINTNCEKSQKSFSIVDTTIQLISIRNQFCKCMGLKVQFYMISQERQKSNQPRNVPFLVPVPLQSLTLPWKLLFPIWRPSYIQYASFWNVASGMYLSFNSKKN